MAKITQEEIDRKVAERIPDFSPVAIYKYDDLSEIGLGTLIKYLKWDAIDHLGLVYDPKHWFRAAQARGGELYLVIGEDEIFTPLSKLAREACHVQARSW